MSLTARVNEVRRDDEVMLDAYLADATESKGCEREEQREL